MEFELNEEAKAVQSVAREFAEKEVLQRAAEIDRKGKFPLDIAKRMAELKLFGLSGPEKYGGSNATLLSYVVMVEELSRASASIGCLSAVGLISIFPILYAGSEEQKEKYLRPLCEGSRLGAFALTEPTAGLIPCPLKQPLFVTAMNTCSTDERRTLRIPLSQTYTWFLHTQIRARREKG